MVSLSPIKIVTMHLHIKCFFCNPNLYLPRGRRLSMVQQTRLPGMIFYCCLTWLPHLWGLKVACTKRLPFFFFFCHLSLGSYHAVFFCLHHSVILSKLDYGYHLYSFATLPRLWILDFIYYAGVRLAAGPFRSCPILNPLVNGELLVLDLHR